MSLEPIQAFTTLCFSCFAINKVTSATDGEKTMYACAGCGAVATVLYGEVPWKEAVHVRKK